ncbi:cytochrome b/b6 domain-containing protein [Streptomyces cavernae]|uniref:cytochrome b/b6 domain-containing protein n=1 Tax=Streptomyces cavernae TaxID=2259034 RepID=UPI00192E4EDC|nr:cytochrome b/b6 domain-containing protein [Streptomyces cavernae]
MTSLSNSSLPKPGRSAYGLATAAVLLLIPAIVLLGGDTVREFLNFGAGVLSLVSLSCSVIWGLVATDRLFLNPRQRIVAQAVHRTTAVSSVAFLLLHVSTKLALDHVGWIAVFIPFGLGVTGAGALIGFGTVAGLLMIFTAITGALRSALAVDATVAHRWRSMHMLAYPAWCAALIHGLYAGREAKPIFTILYGLCLAGVIAALLLRAAPAPFKRRAAQRIQMVLGSEGRGPVYEKPIEARAAAAAGGGTGSLPGFGSRPRGGDSFGEPAGAGRRSGSSPLLDSQRAAMTDTGGFAAAYRATNSNQGGPDTGGFRMPNPQDTGGFQMPAGSNTGSFQMPNVQDTGGFQMPDMQPTQSMPRVDGPGSTSGNWPIPSPPPVGEAPPSSYDPMNDTGYNIPAYGSQGSAAYLSDVRDTGESNAAFGTYNSNDTYDSGPTTEVRPGAFDAPNTGEPWNAPSGGFK